METSLRLHPDDLAGLQADPYRYRFQRGVQLVVAAEEWKPHLQRVTGGSAGEAELQYEGPVMNLLLVLADTMNFTFVLRRQKDGAWGTTLDNGTVTGMVGMIHRQEVDIALGPFGLTAERAIVAEFATPLFSDASLLFAALGRPEVDPWGFLLPFSHSLWAATMGALGLGVVAATVMVVAGTRRSLWVAPHCWWRVIFDLIFVSCGVLCQQSVEGKYTTTTTATTTSKSNNSNSIKGCGRWAGRVVVGGWIVVAMVLAWAYMGALTSLLAVRYVPQPFQTLAALGRHTATLLLVQESTAEAHLLQTGGPVVLRGLERVREEGRLREVRRDYLSTYLPMARGKPWVVVAEWFSAMVVADRHFSLTGRCDYYTSREILVSYIYSIILQKNSSLLRAVNARLLAVAQGGLYRYWLKAALPNATYCRYPPSVITVKGNLGLANLWGVFTVLAGGLASSILAFCCELLTAPRRPTASC